MTLTVEDVASVVLGVGWRLREAGKQVSTAELVKAVELAESYRTLTGSLSKSDLALVLSAAFTSVRVPQSMLEDLVAKELAGRGVRERAERISREIREAVEAIGARPGDRVSRKRIARGKNGRERRRALAHYTKLKNIGAIRGRPGRERILSPHEIEKLAWELARSGYRSLDQASRAQARMGWDDLLTAAEARVRPDSKQLEGMSEKSLLELAEAARRKHDRLTRSLVAEELARRINAGVRVSRPDEVAELLEEAGIFTAGLRRRLASSSKLDPSKLSPEDVVDLATSMGPEAGGELVARRADTLPPEEARRMLRSLDPRLYWALGKSLVKKLNDPLLEAAVEASKALVEALRYARSMDEARADMAKHYIDRAHAKLESALEKGPSRGELVVDESRVASLINEASAIIMLASSLNGAANPGVLYEALRGLDYYSRIRLLRDAYNYSTPEWRRLILSAAERMLDRLSAREGLRLLREAYRSKMPPGRVDVRRSIYESIRYSPRPIVYARRRRTARLTLALDASSSMMEYSTWALAVSSLFPRHLQRLVVFSHYTRVYEGPFTRREFARALFEAEFRGYTNISAALRDSTVPGVKKIVVVTDLWQTVDDEPVHSTVARLTRSGKRIVFIVPRSHDEQARRLVEENGGRVVLATNPRRAAQHLLRILLRG